MFESDVSSEALKNYTRVLIHEESFGNKNDRVFAVRCFSPKLCFEQIMAEVPHSIVLASGTLSPMENLETEFGIGFAVKREFPHVIKDSQVVISAVSEFGGETFDFSYAKRDNPAMLNKLGTFIQKVSIGFRGSGVLVFFPSYSMMTKCK